MRRILFILLLIPCILNGQFIKKDGSFLKKNGQYVRTTSTRIPVAYVPVTNVNLTSSGDATTVDSSRTLQFSAEILPPNATDESVTWSVTDLTGTATTTQGGLMTGGDQGTVRMVVTSQSIEGIADSITITITEYTPPSPTTGAGRILWVQDLEDIDLTNLITGADADIIIGNEEPSNSFHLSESENPGKILDETDNRYMQFWIDGSDQGSSGGIQMFKTLRETPCGYWSQEPAPDSLWNKVELWTSYNTRYSTGFYRSRDGKNGVTMRGSQAYNDYNGSDHWENYVDGFGIHHYWQPGSSGTTNTYRHLIYWPEMTSDYGVKFGEWREPWPDGSSIICDDEWHNVAMRLRLNPAPPSGTGCIIEMFIDEYLVYRQMDFQLRTDDSINIDWIGWRFFANSDAATPSTDWYKDFDDLYIYEFSEGDSTFTGGDTIPNYQRIDVPGWPKGEDITNWGKF